MWPLLQTPADRQLWGLSGISSIVLLATMNVMNSGKKETLRQFSGDIKQQRIGSEWASVAQVVHRKSWNHLCKGNREYRPDSGSSLQQETRLPTVAGTWQSQPPHSHLQKIGGCCFQPLSMETAWGSCSTSGSGSCLSLQLFLCQLILAGMS